MKATFDVLDQGWIPVVDENGSRQLMGIRQVLSEAHRLREISDPSPLEEYSLYRFLTVFLMDALRPKTRSNISDLLKKGRFDMPQIERYIAQCLTEGVSFDLFDEERPFLQCKMEGAIDGNEKPVAVLDCTVPSGNNHMHFVHQQPDRLSPDAALRKVLVTYWFCTAAAQGYPSGVYGAPPYFGVIREDHLFGTLVNLLLPTDSIELGFDDSPVLWRRTVPIRQKEQVPKTSWLEGMLFPTRRIHLNPDESGTVRSVFMSQGENYVNKDSWKDPHATYRMNENSVFPLRPHADNPIWRNITDIIDIPGGGASKILNVYRDIHGNDSEIRYTLYGVETSQASYLSVQRHDLSLPLRLAEQDRLDLLKACIAAVDRLSKALYKSLNVTEVIPPAAIRTAKNHFEKICENRFWQLCRFADVFDADEQMLYGDYLSEIYNAAEKIFDQTLISLHLRSHALSSAEENRKKIFFEMNKLKKEAGL